LIIFHSDQNALVQSVVALVRREDCIFGQQLQGIQNYDVCLGICDFQSGIGRERMRINHLKVRSLVKNARLRFCQ
jgi:hypothetical protein